MTGYVPDPNDATQPTDATIAETAAAEFRALKAKVNAMVLASGTRIPVRQTVLSALLDATGIAAFLGISATAFGVDLLAGTSSFAATWANGFSNAGAVDMQQVLSADLANEWPLLRPNNTSYLSLDYVDGVTTPTPTQTLAPPHYAAVYPQARQSVLQFAGAAGAVTFKDDFGNTWAAQGAAKVETDYFKFGTGALGGGGASNALDGAADFIKSTSFSGVTFTKEGWSMRCWTKPLNGLPAAGQHYRLGSFVNAGGFGAEFGIRNTGGTIKFAYNLSSTGAANDIAANVQGTTTPVLGTEYFVELTYDALAGTYRLYVNGAQEASTASALKVCGTTGGAVGAALGGGANTFFKGYIDKFELLPYCSHPNGTAYAVPTAAPSVATQGYSCDWFDTINYVMHQVSAASTTAGTNPTFTQKNRLYVGEGDTNGVTVTAVRPYAIAGKFITPWIAPLPAPGTAISKNHNLGTDIFNCFLEAQNVTGDDFYTAGQILDYLSTINASSSHIMSIAKDRNIAAFVTGLTASGMAGSAAGGTLNMTAADWQYRMVAQRRF